MKELRFTWTAALLLLIGACADLGDGAPRNPACRPGAVSQRPPEGGPPPKPAPKPPPPPMVPPPTHPAHTVRGTTATTDGTAPNAPVEMIAPPEGGGGSPTPQPMIPPPTHPAGVAPSPDAIGPGPCEEDDAEPQVWDGTGRGEAVRGT